MPRTSNADPKHLKSRRSLASLSDALVLLLERKSFDDVTVRDLAAEAGIGTATFYRHYPDKGALLDAVTNAEIDAFVELAMALLGEAGEKARALALIDYVSQHKRLWTALLAGGAAGMIRQGIVGRLEKEIGSGLPEGQGWVPAELGIAFGATATVEIIVWWLRQEQSVDREQVAEYLDRLAIAPTLSRGPHARPVTYVGKAITLRVDGSLCILPAEQPSTGR